MKAGWEETTLGELFDITSSKRVFESEWTTTGVPFYRAREIVRLAKNGFVTNDLFISEEMFEQYSGKYGAPKEGDLIVTGVGTLGICYRVRKVDRFYFKDGNCIWLKRTSNVDSRYVEYAFQCRQLRDQIDDAEGATVGTYTIIKAKSTKIPLPPLDEQKRIVEVLDAAFEGLSRARAHTETNLQNARELFGTTIQSLLNHEADDPASVQTSLGEVCEIHSGAGFPDKYQGQSSGEFPFFKVGDMNKAGNEVALKTANNYISEDVRAMLGAKVFKPNSIVFPKVGGAIATNKKRKIVVPSCVDNNVMGLWPIPGRIDAEYLSWWLQGFDIYEFSNKAALPSITKTTVSDWPLILPPKHRQQEIASELQILWSQTEDLQSHYRAKLADLDALRQALLQKAFAGELT